MFSSRQGILPFSCCMFFRILPLTLLFLPSFTVAQPISISMSVGSGLMDGDTTYEIGSGGYDPQFGYTEYRSPISELKFPLQVFMSWTKGNITLLDRFQMQGHFKYSLNDSAGKMEDSDWGVHYYNDSNWEDPNSLDIFSLSDASLDARMSDISFRVKLYANKDDVKYWLGLGFLHQKMDYDISNLDQWYPSLDEARGQQQDHYYVNGLVLIYQASYNIPYIEFATTAQLTPQIYIDARMGFSPFARARDDDNHILINKISHGKADGHAFIFNVDARYTFWRNVFISMELDLFGAYTEGIQSQYVNQKFLTTIETKIESRQMYAGLALGGHF